MTEEIKKEEAQEIIQETEPAEPDSELIPAATVTQPDPEGPPEVAGEPQDPPPDPSIIGELEKNELALLNAIQGKQRALTFQLGELEIRKAMILGQIQALDNQASDVYKGVAARLEIGANVHWTITADHKVRTLPTPNAPQP